MSILAVNRLCRDVMRDPNFRVELQRDPETTLAAYPEPLTEEERAIVLAGDVGTLYQRGGNSFLMGYLARYKVFGLDMGIYSARMAGLDEQMSRGQGTALLGKLNAGAGIHAARIQPIMGQIGLDLIGRARELAPAIAAAAPQIDADRQIPDDLFTRLTDAGLYHLLAPKMFGGSELTPSSFLEVIETIAKADASTAWCIAQTAVCSMAAAYLDPAVAREVFATPRGVLAWGPPSRGAKAVAAPGGYRVTGNWMFASGSRQATWLAGHCSLFDEDGKPRTTPEGQPIERSMVFPRTAASITDVWHVVGLRGTGSDNYAVSDLFVPAAFSFGRDSSEDRQHPGALYRMSMFHMFAAGFGAVALGIAQTVLESFVELAGKKTPMLRQSTLSENALVQSQIGLGKAKILASRAFLLQSVRDMWDGACQSDITLEQRAAMRMASTYAIHQAKDVVDTIYHAAGATAVFEGNPYERRLRDIHAVTQQIQGHYSLFEIVGQQALGMNPNFKLL